MNDQEGIAFPDALILSLRGKKNPVDPYKPYGWLIEKELTAAGAIEDTATIFLTNRECPFHCLMCDLWKNTTDETVPSGAIESQIKSVLNSISGVKHLKLYNSGSFFDPKAIPPGDYEGIASLLGSFDTIIVESHPAFINESVLKWKDALNAHLEVAIGLETINPVTLKRLNKHTDLRSFEHAVRFLVHHHIGVRAFILLKPPFTAEEEGIEWAKKSIDFAFGAGVECCTVIPVRGGNGAMENLLEKGLYSPPSVGSLEEVLEYGIKQGKGRVFADTWDLQLFSDCPVCFEETRQRIMEMNLHQRLPKQVYCLCKA